MNPFVFGYNRFSEGAKYLKHVTGGSFGYPDGVTSPKENQPVINWGSSHEPAWAWKANVYLNKPEAVATAVNKKKTFLALQKAGVPIPQFTQDIKKAMGWLQDGNTVFARSKLTGSQALDLHLYNPRVDKKLPTFEELEDYKIFTKQFMSEHEFKIVVINKKVKAVMYFKRDPNLPDNRKFLREHNGGWRYHTTEKEIHPIIARTAINAINACGLDFGVVDIGCGRNVGDLVVYEVNTAPGIKKPDARWFARRFREEYGFDYKINLK